MNLWKRDSDYLRAPKNLIEYMPVFSRLSRPLMAVQGILLIPCSSTVGNRFRSSIKTRPSPHPISSTRTDGDTRHLWSMNVSIKPRPILAPISLRLRLRYSSLRLWMAKAYLVLSGSIRHIIVLGLLVKPDQNRLALVQSPDPSPTGGACAPSPARTAQRPRRSAGRGGRTRRWECRTPCPHHRRSIQDRPVAHTTSSAPTVSIPAPAGQPLISPALVAGSRDAYRIFRITELSHEPVPYTGPFVLDYAKQDRIPDPAILVDHVIADHAFLNCSQDFHGRP